MYSYKMAARDWFESLTSNEVAALFSAFWNDVQQQVIHELIECFTWTKYPTSFSRKSTALSCNDECSRKYVRSLLIRGVSQVCPPCYMGSASEASQTNPTCALEWTNKVAVSKRSASRALMRRYTSATAASQQINKQCSAGISYESEQSGASHSIDGNFLSRAKAASYLISNLVLYPVCVGVKDDISADISHRSLILTWNPLSWSNTNEFAVTADQFIGSFFETNNASEAQAKKRFSVATDSDENLPFPAWYDACYKRCCSEQVSQARYDQVSVIQQKIALVTLASMEMAIQMWYSASQNGCAEHDHTIIKLHQKCPKTQVSCNSVFCKHLGEFGNIKPSWSSNLGQFLNSTSLAPSTSVESHKSETYSRHHKQFMLSTAMRINNDPRSEQCRKIIKWVESHDLSPLSSSFESEGISLPFFSSILHAVHLKNVVSVGENTQGPCDTSELINNLHSQFLLQSQEYLTKELSDNQVVRTQSPYEQVGNVSNVEKNNHHVNQEDLVSAFPLDAPQSLKKGDADKQRLRLVMSNLALIDSAMKSNTNHLPSSLALSSTLQSASLGETVNCTEEVPKCENSGKKKKKRKKKKGKQTSIIDDPLSRRSLSNTTTDKQEHTKSGKSQVTNAKTDPKNNPSDLGGISNFSAQNLASSSKPLASLAESSTLSVMPPNTVSSPKSALQHTAITDNDKKAVISSISTARPSSPAQSDSSESISRYFVETRHVNNHASTGRKDALATKRSQSQSAPKHESNAARSSSFSASPKDQHNKTDANPPQTESPEEDTWEVVGKKSRKPKRIPPTLRIRSSNQQQHQNKQHSPPIEASKSRNHQSNTNDQQTHLGILNTSLVTEIKGHNKERRKRGGRQQANKATRDSGALSRIDLKKQTSSSKDNKVESISDKLVPMVDMGQTSSHKSNVEDANKDKTLAVSPKPARQGWTPVLKSKTFDSSQKNEATSKSAKMTNGFHVNVNAKSDVKSTSIAKVHHPENSTMCSMPVPTFLGVSSDNSASSSVSSSLGAHNSRDICQSGVSSDGPSQIQKNAKKQAEGYHLLDVCERLTRDIKIFMDRRAAALKCRRNERQALLGALHATLGNIWPEHPRVEIMGSCATQLDLPSSDLDLVICGLAPIQDNELDDSSCKSTDTGSPRFQPHHLSHSHSLRSPSASRVVRLAYELERQPWVVQVKAIPTATVPVVKMLADPSKFPQNHIPPTNNAFYECDSPVGEEISSRRSSTTKSNKFVFAPSGSVNLSSVPSSISDGQVQDGTSSSPFSFASASQHGRYMSAPNSSQTPSSCIDHGMSPSLILQQPWRGADLLNGLLSVDITFEGPGHGGVGSTLFALKVVEDACEEFSCQEHPDATPPVQLIMVLKELLAQKRLNEPFSGGLSSYSVLLMVCAALRECRALRNEIHHSSSPDSFNIRHDLKKEKIVSARQIPADMSCEKFEPSQNPLSPNDLEPKKHPKDANSNSAAYIHVSKTEREQNKGFNSGLKASPNQVSSWATIAGKGKLTNQSNIKCLKVKEVSLSVPPVTKSNSANRPTKKLSYADRVSAKKDADPSVDLMEAKSTESAKFVSTKRDCNFEYVEAEGRHSPRLYQGSSKHNGRVATLSPSVTVTTTISSDAEYLHGKTGTAGRELEPNRSTSERSGINASLIRNGAGCSSDTLEVLCSGEITSGKLLMYFLLLYGKVFDAQSTAVDMLAPGSSPFVLRQFTGHGGSVSGGGTNYDPVTGVFSVDPIVVFDPLEGEEGKNVARSCFAWYSIRQMFGQCYATLTQSMEASARAHHHHNLRTGSTSDHSEESSPLLALLLSY